MHRPTTVLFCLLWLIPLSLQSQRGIETPKDQTLQCPSGQAISRIWNHPKTEKEPKSWSIECSNVTFGCHEHCVWSSACDPARFGATCYVRGVQMGEEKGNSSQKAVYLCCNGTVNITLCPNDLKDTSASAPRSSKEIGRVRRSKSEPSHGRPKDHCIHRTLQCQLDVHRVKQDIGANPEVAKLIGLDGLANVPGLTITKEATTSAVVVTSCTELNEECTEEEEAATFEKFRDKFPSKDFQPDNQARDQFRDNLDKLHGLKSECTLTPEDATFTVGKFGDMSLDQMVKVMGGLMPEGGQAPYKVRNRYKRTWQRYKAFDWRDRKVVPAVRNQNYCGSCYAFTVSELVMIQANIERKVTVPDGHGSAYSAQFILDCFQAPQAYGCLGGRPYSLMRYLTDRSGAYALPAESCYRYNSSQGTCESNACQSTKTGKIKQAFFLDVTQSEKETMANLLRWGPVLSTIELTPAVQMYHGGIIRSYQCGTRPNHAIIIVGYDFSGDIPYYVIKNSWGTDWGISGYAKFEAGANTCGLAKSVISICVEAACGDRTDYLVAHPNAPK